MSSAPHIIEKAARLPEKLIFSFENAPIPAWAIPFIILFYSLLRIQFEALFICSKCVSYHTPWYMYTHGALSFFFAYISGTLILLFAVREEPLKIMRVTAIGFAIIMLPPVIDGLVFHRKVLYNYVWYGRGGWNIYPVSWLLFHFVNDYVAGPALKAEIWAVSTLSFIYCYLKSRKFLRSLLVMVITISIFLLVAYQLILLTGFSKATSVARALYWMRFSGKNGMEAISTYGWALAFVFMAILTSFRTGVVIQKFDILSTGAAFFLLIIPSFFAVFDVNPLLQKEYMRKLLFAKFVATTGTLPLIWTLLKSEQRSSFVTDIRFMILGFLFLLNLMLYHNMPVYYVFLSAMFIIITALLGLLRLSFLISFSLFALIALFNWLGALFLVK